MTSEAFPSPPSNGMARSPPPPPPLILPFRYAIVEDGVMRGAHPTLKNYRFLRRLRLKSIVSLMAEPPTPDLAEFCASEGVDLVYRRVQKYDDGEVLSMSEALVAEMIAFLLDETNHPVFLHCRDGGHNTGLIIMCLRRLQHWTNEAIHDEHRRYTKGNEIHYQEEQFVEAFSGPVRIPAMLPAWLWGGACIRTHPSVKILYEPGTSPVPQDPPSRAASAMKQYLHTLGSHDDDPLASGSMSLNSPESAQFQRGFPRRSSRSNHGEDFKAFTAAVSQFPSVSDDVVLSGSTFPLSFDDGGDDGVGVAAGLSDFIGGVSTAGGNRAINTLSQGLRTDTRGSGDARDDYHGFPATPSPGSYSMERAGLELAGLDLAAPRTRSWRNTGRPSQSPDYAGIGGGNVSSGS